MALYMHAYTLEGYIGAWASHFLILHQLHCPLMLGYPLKECLHVYRWLRIVYLGKCKLRGPCLHFLAGLSLSWNFIHSAPSPSTQPTHRTMASLMSTVRLGLRTGLKAECRSFVTSTQPATWTRKDIRHHFFFQAGFFFVPHSCRAYQQNLSWLQKEEEGIRCWHTRKNRKPNSLTQLFIAFLR